MASESAAELGIPFPRFERPSDQASEDFGLGACSLSDAENRHGFHPDIGCAVIVDCPKCGAPNGLDASDREDTSCRLGEAVISFPHLSDDEILAC